MADLNFDVNLGDNQFYGGNQKQDAFGGKPVNHQVLYPNLAPETNQQQTATATAQPTNEPSQSKVALLGFLTVEFYQPYFNVTTNDVRERIISSINPIKPRFFEITNSNPDLYGPVWIYTTLVLVLAATGNFSQQEYDYSFVPTAALLIYGYGFIFPIILTILLKVFGSNTISYVHTICCYGYSLTVFIPAFILAAIPVPILQWVVIIAAIVSSTLFLVVNYAHELKSYVGKQRYILIGFIGVAQVVLLLCFKLLFFSGIEDKVAKEVGN